MIYGDTPNFQQRESVASSGSKDAQNDPQAAVSPPSRQKRPKPLQTPAFGHNSENVLREFNVELIVEDGQ